MPDPPTRILILDDDPASLVKVCEGLSSRLPEAVVVTAPSAEAGFEFLKASEFDVILCGVRLPGMTCLEFLKQARAHSSDPVILVTAGPEVSRKEVLREGAFGFIPAGTQNMSELIHQITAAVQKAALVRRLHELNARSLKNPGTL